MAPTTADTAPSPYRPTTADRIGLGFLMGVVALLGASRLAAAIARIVSFAGDGPHQFPVTPLDTSATVSFDAAGTPTDVLITAGTLTVTELSGAETGLLIAQEIVAALAIATVVVTLIMLGRNTLRGAIFRRSNTALIVTAGFAAVFGIALSGFIGQMASNEVISRLSAGSPAVYGAQGDPIPYFLGAFAIGIVATAYSVGARIQRETEGLV